MDRAARSGPATRVVPSIADGGTRADSLRLLRGVGAKGGSQFMGGVASIAGPPPPPPPAIDTATALCGVEAWTLPRGLYLLPGVTEATFLTTPNNSPVVATDAMYPGQLLCGPGVTASPADQPLYTMGSPDQPANSQMEPVEVRFDTAVATVGVYGRGAIKCYSEHYGRVIAYNAADSVIDTKDMQMRDPTDCAADSITYGAYGTVSGPRPLIRRVVIEPMQPWSWDFIVDGQLLGEGIAVAHYMLVMSAVPAGVVPVALPALTLTPDRTGLLAPAINAYRDGLCNVSAQASSRGFTVQVTAADPAHPVSLSGRTVNVAVNVTRFSGGHQHDVTRPTGSFSAATDQATMSVVTDATGRARFVYYPPEPSGEYTLTATTARAPSAVSVTTVGYALPPLSNYANYTLTGTTTIHPDAHHATPTMAAALRVLADSLRAFSGAVLGVNDESLPLGGLFDLDANWHPPKHCSHRRGTAADIHNRTLSDAERQTVRRVWLRLTALEPATEADHLHLKTKR